MAIGFSPEPKEIKFHAVDYSNIEVIRGLTKFYYNLRSDLDFKPNMEVLAILADVGNAIKYSGLTDKQKKCLYQHMLGWNEVEAGSILHITRQAFHNTIEFACKKISKYLGRKQI